MNFKTTPIIIIIFLVLFSTIYIAIKKPELHKQTFITDYKQLFIEETEENTQNINTAPKTVIKEQPLNIVQKTNTPDIKIQTKQQNTKQIPKTIKTNNVKPKQTPVKTVKQQTIKNTEIKTKPIPVPKEQEQTVKVIQKQPQIEEKIIKTETKKTEQPQQITQPKVLTEQEEIIVWNKWRSDLQNQVMRDTKIRAPHGTGFKFSFTVDKYGNMSNIKVWSTNSVYTDLAVRVIKPVLQAYQHKPILNFPNGTKRVITNVTGGFVISTTTQYSTPADYSDYERVKTTK